MNKRKVAIIGSGLGGLSAACYLAKNGFDVTVLEKNNQIGGRVMQWSQDGFTFDLGPSWYWTPNIFEKFFSDFGRKSSDFFELVRLDPSYKIFWNKEDIDDIPKNLEDVKKIFEKYEKGSSIRLQKLLDNGKFMLDLALERFLYREYKSIVDLLNPTLLINGLKLNIFTNLQRVIDSNFSNSRVKKMVTWHSLFLGATPQILPALYIFMLYIDFVEGTWYPKGGMHQLPRAMFDIANELGVKFHLNTPVDKIHARAMFDIANELGVKFHLNTPVDKIHVENSNAKYVISKNERFYCDYVVANADYPFVEMNLLEKKYRTYDENYWKSKKVSPSSLLFYFGIKKKLRNVIHHNYYFDQNWDSHFGSLFTKPSWPDGEPSFYFSITSKTDKTAPNASDNLFVLIPVASGLDDSSEIRNKYRNYVVKKIQEITKQQFEDDIVLERIISQKDQKEMYNSYMGSCFGLAQTLFQSLNFRPKNRSKKVKNLVYAGHFTHPGISMPMTVISGQIASDIIKSDFAK